MLMYLYHALESFRSVFFSPTQLAAVCAVC